MEEKNEKLEAGDVKIKLRVPEKLDNFWYHYKWHTIASLLGIFFITILVLQTCSRTPIDSYILYAGPHEIKHTSSDGNMSAYSATVSALKRVTDDYDGDGAMNISLLNLFVINSEEAKELVTPESGLEVNYTLVSEDTKRLEQTLMYGEYYVCFLSERLFSEHEKETDGILFAPLEEYAVDGVEYEYASERGIYLRSLPFGDLPYISDLPDDTVVCLRRLSELSSHVGSKENKEFFRRGEDIITKILSYGK